MNYLVLSAIGKDRPGIVNELSKVILDANCNIVDSRMTVLGGEFAIILMVSGVWSDISRLESRLPGLQDKTGLTIVLRHTEKQASGGPLLPYEIDVVSLDHPGIVHELANFFSTRNINIHELATDSYAAAHTGSPMFAVHMVINIPGQMHIADLRDDFLDFCDGLNLDASINPSKG